MCLLNVRIPRDTKSPPPCFKHNTISERLQYVFAHFYKFTECKILAAFTNRRCSEKTPPTKHRHSSRSPKRTLPTYAVALYSVSVSSVSSRGVTTGAPFSSNSGESPCISRKTEEIIYARMRIHNDLNAFHAALRIGLYESFLFHFSSDLNIILRNAARSRRSPSFSL